MYRLLRFLLIPPLAIAAVLLIILAGIGITAQRFTPWRFSAAEASLGRVVGQYMRLVRWVLRWR